jgi:hypothetical protein
MDGSGRLWPRAELRVGDADRQGVVGELQRHYVDGRLSSDELDERVAQVLAARTFGELAIPLNDLPVLASPTPQLAVPHDHPREFAFAPLLGALLVAVGMLALLTTVVFPVWNWGLMPFWPVFIFGFLFIGRPRHGGRRHR